MKIGGKASLIKIHGGKPGLLTWKTRPLFL
jgi:hypothetical protein